MKSINNLSVSTNATRLHEFYATKKQSPEIEAWNARIKVEKEAKKRAKLERKFDHATRSI